jgi:hypothetical protein
MDRWDSGAQLRSDALQSLERWAALNGSLLQTIFRLFSRDGRWPLLADVESDSGLESSQHRLAQQWSQVPLGLVQAPADGSAALLARALSFVPEAGPLLLCLVDLVQLAVERYLEDGNRAILDASVAERSLGVDPASLGFVVSVLRHEPAIGGDWLADGDWTWIVRESILEYRNAHSPQQLLDEQAWLLWPDGPVNPAMLRAVRDRSAVVQLLPVAG